MDNDRPINIESPGPETSTSSSSVRDPESWLARTVFRQLSRANNAADASPVPPSTESTAAAAQRHRLNNNDILDFQAAFSWIEQITPFLLLMLLVYVHQHLLSILQLVWLLGTLIRMNQHQRKLMATRENFKMSLVITGIICVVANLALALWWPFSAPDYWMALFLMPGQATLSTWHTLLHVSILDTVIKIVGMLPKMLVVVCHTGTVTPQSTRHLAHSLNMIEHCLLLYRTAVPAGIWIRYFLGSSSKLLLARAFTGVYIGLKVGTAWQRLYQTWIAGKLVFRRGAVYGVYVSGDEVMEGGNSCPICQDSLKNPIKLRCCHIFCEECICEWMERDRTCPMCRADIRPKGMQLFSTGTSSLLPQIF